MKAITPYLIFDGNCREAMTFYKTCLRADLEVSTYGEGDAGAPPETKDRVIHARLSRGETVLMASDTHTGMPPTVGDNLWLSLVCESDDEVGTLFFALVDGGKTVMAPHDAFWGARFAMLTDRFGMNWMLNFDRSGAVKSGSEGQREGAAAR